MTGRRQGFVARRSSGSWYRNSRVATAPPVEFVPGPQMTAAEAEEFAAPDGTSKIGWQLLYLACWVEQIAGGIGAVVSLGVLVSTILGGAQSTIQGCQTGNCASSSAADVVVPVLWFVGCTAAAVLGRPLRREAAALLRSAALRSARAIRAEHQTDAVIVETLPPRDRWLLHSADRMLANYPPDLAEQVLWDIARRLDAATALKALPAGPNGPPQDTAPQAAEISAALVDQVERDVAAVRKSVQDEAAYRHQPCRTSSLSALPRTSEPGTLIRDAALLLPEHRTTVRRRKGAVQ